MKTFIKYFDQFGDYLESLTTPQYIGVLAGACVVTGTAMYLALEVFA